jgi:hypothetical protein
MVSSVSGFLLAIVILTVAFLISRIRFVTIFEKRKAGEKRSISFECRWMRPADYERFKQQHAKKQQPPIL